jgi:hypothetical protein
MQRFGLAMAFELGFLQTPIGQEDLLHQLENGRNAIRIGSWRLIIEAALSGAARWYADLMGWSGGRQHDSASAFWSYAHRYFGIVSEEERGFETLLNDARRVMSDQMIVPRMAIVPAGTILKIAYTNRSHVEYWRSGHTTSVENLVPRAAGEQTLVVGGDFTIHENVRFQINYGGQRLRDNLLQTTQIGGHCTIINPCRGAGGARLFDPRHMITEIYDVARDNWVPISFARALDHAQFDALARNKVSMFHNPRTGGAWATIGDLVHNANGDEKREFEGYLTDAATSLASALGTSEDAVAALAAAVQALAGVPAPPPPPPRGVGGQFAAASAARKPYKMASGTGNANAVLGKVPGLRALVKATGMPMNTYVTGFADQIAQIADVDSAPAQPAAWTGGVGGAGGRPAAGGGGRPAAGVAGGGGGAGGEAREAAMRRARQAQAEAAAAAAARRAGQRRGQLTGREADAAAEAAEAARRATEEQGGGGGGARSPLGGGAGGMASGSGEGSSGGTETGGTVVEASPASPSSGGGGGDAPAALAQRVAALTPDEALAEARAAFFNTFNGTSDTVFPALNAAAEIIGQHVLPGVSFVETEGERFYNARSFEKVVGYGNNIFFDVQGEEGAPQKYSPETRARTAIAAYAYPSDPEINDRAAAIGPSRTVLEAIINKWQELMQEAAVPLVDTAVVFDDIAVRANGSDYRDADDRLMTLYTDILLFSMISESGKGYDKAALQPGSAAKKMGDVNMIKLLETLYLRDTGSRSTSKRDMFIGATGERYAAFPWGTGSLRGTLAEQYANIQELDPMDIYRAAIAALPCTAQCFKALVDHGVIPPVGVILHRPWRQYVMGAVLLCNPGSQYMELMYGSLNTVSSLDGATKAVLVNFTGDWVALLKDPRHGLVVPNAVGIEYQCGEDSVFFKDREDLTRQLGLEHRTASIVPRLVPYAVTPVRVPNPMYIRGIAPSGMWHGLPVPRDVRITSRDAMDPETGVPNDTLFQYTATTDVWNLGVVNPHGTVWYDARPNAQQDVAYSLLDNRDDSHVEATWQDGQRNFHHMRGTFEVITNPTAGWRRCGPGCRRYRELGASVAAPMAPIPVDMAANSAVTHGALTF